MSIYYLAHRETTMKIPVRIRSIRQETPTVKSYTLDLEGQKFSFHPGQWVDCYVDVDGERGVAGYTLTSSPTTEGMIELTVKRSEEREVTRFMHEEAETGDVIYVDGGQGDFYYLREMGDSVTLIAGGIGITPLMSMLRYVDEGTSDVRAKLFYSVKAPSEIIFRKQGGALGGAHWKDRRRAPQGGRGGPRGHLLHLRAEAHGAGYEGDVERSRGDRRTYQIRAVVVTRLL